MCIYIRNQIKILQRNEMCCQRGAAASVFFFFNQSLHSSPVMSVMFADRAFRTAEKERASAFSFSSFIWIFLVYFRDILLGSLFSWCCFVFLFPIRSLWCVLSAFPEPGVLSVQYFPASTPSAYPSLPQHSSPPGSCTTASSFPLNKMKGTSAARPWRQIQLKTPAANPPPPSKSFAKKLKLFLCTKNILNNPAFFGSRIQSFVHLEISGPKPRLS